MGRVSERVDRSQFCKIGFIRIQHHHMLCDSIVTYLSNFQTRMVRVTVNIVDTPALRLAASAIIIADHYYKWYMIDLTLITFIVH